ncbi:MAG: hypothetical protein M5U19_02485 [Microthrixaceae bacterium]|nr:hypothetical protein [Microthrixaceae bacterium]
MAHPPGVEPVPPFAVQRARLEEVLDAVPPGGVGLLVAAAGWGKSLLIAQWLASNGSTDVTSISVAGRHNDAMSFGADLLEAFGDLERPLDPNLREHLVSGSAGLGADFFDRLVSDLAAQPCQIVLVLDDLHQLTNEAILDDLGRFLQRLPPNVRVVAAMRWDVALSTRQLRMAGKLVEVRAAELAFTPEEARRMVRSLSGHELDDRQVELLVDRTEGWAAGLQLASISLRTADDRDDFPPRLRGERSARGRVPDRGGVVPTRRANAIVPPADLGAAVADRRPVCCGHRS